MLTTVVILTLVALAQSHDIKVGNSTEGRKIFDQVRHASPTIWRQTENLTINTTDAEVISRVVITDLRPDKDGDVKIVEGGEGHKNVTIELKSPTVLRGYDFQVEVYAVPENNQDKNDETQNKDITTDPGQVRKQRNPEEFSKNGNPNVDLPLTVFEDAKKLESTTGKNSPGSIINDTKVNEDETSADNNTEKVNEDKLKLSRTDAGKEIINPAAIDNQQPVNDDHSRHSRDATSESPNVSEPTTPKENKDLQRKLTTKQVRPVNNLNGFVIHPEIDYSNYSSSDLFSNINASAPNTQEEKRNVSEIFKNDDKTNEKTKTVDDPKTISTSTAKPVAENLTDAQQPKINVPFPRRTLDPVPYPIQGTTTEKSQNKREADLKNTKTIQHEEKEDVKNLPRFLGEQNSTISEQKPVISIQ